MKKEILILGLLVAFGFGFFTSYFLVKFDYKNESCGMCDSKMMSKCQMDQDGQHMHMMPDGTMMNNSDTSMRDMMHDMNKNLIGKKGDELDLAFLEEMIVHHEGAVEMANILKAGTKRPELIRLADDIIIAQTQEIKMMKDWKKAWFNK